MHSPRPAAITIFPGRNYRKELEHLRARLFTINAMIDALEAYRRVRKLPYAHHGKRAHWRHGRQFASILPMRPDSSASDTAPG